jgi:hypothetical protein
MFFVTAFAGGDLEQLHERSLRYAKYVVIVSQLLAATQQISQRVPKLNAGNKTEKPSLEPYMKVILRGAWLNVILTDRIWQKGFVQLVTTSSGHH